jgi:hypothetical protein
MTMIGPLPLAALSMLLLQSAGPPSPVPVWSGSLPPPGSVRGNFCNVAVVTGLRPSRHLLVRAGPGTTYSRVDRLAAGEQVYTCNGRREWIGVVYRRPGFPCDGAAPQGLDIRLSTECRSGWVHRNWVEIITG